jgi:hypothetical protein
MALRPELRQWPQHWLVAKQEKLRSVHYSQEKT